MDLPNARRVVPRLEIVASTASTNADLVALAADPVQWPDLAVLATDDQTAGRGRLGRTWTAPAGRALAISVVVRPPGGVPADHWGWYPLLAGAALAEAVRDAGVDASVKWPNDVLVGERKLAGILAERLADGSAVVIGAGLNTLLGADELPVPTATSLAIEGAETDQDAVAAAYLERLAELTRRFASSGGDSGASGLASAVRSLCGTIGREVRVELPGGEVITGRADDLDALGRLIIATDAGPRSVAAGDVTHLRY